MIYRSKDKPRYEIVGILAEKGIIEEVEITGSRGVPGDVYESRILEKRVSGNYALALVESGSIDTHHELYLVKISPRLVALIKRALVATPAMRMPEIEILNLEEHVDIATVHYKIGQEGFNGKFQLEQEQQKTTRTRLVRIEG